MSNFNTLETDNIPFDERIQQAIDRDTNDFNVLVAILGRNPKQDFAEGDLSRFDLLDADLSEADLHQTNLTEATIIDANLSKSNLVSANFTRANLTNVNLTDADLTGANLTDTELNDSNLDRVNLSEVRAAKATFKNTQGLTQSQKDILEQKSAEIIDDVLPEDRKLQDLVTAFCQQTSQPGSREYNRAAYRLLTVIQKLPGLKRNHQAELYRQDYEEIFNDTLFEIAKKICSSGDDSFQPEGGSYTASLTKWINYKLRLYYKPKDLMRQFQHKPMSLDRYISEDGNSTFVETITDSLTLNGIDKLIEEAQMATDKKVTAQIRERIEQDRGGELRECYADNQTQCNCQFLSEQRILAESEVSFSKLSQELGVKIPTLTSHWYRKCIPMLRKIAEEVRVSEASPIIPILKQAVRVPCNEPSTVLTTLADN
jgi:hypothetical protein